MKEATYTSVVKDMRWFEDQPFGLLVTLDLKSVGALQEVTKILLKLNGLVDLPSWSEGRQRHLELGASDSVLHHCRAGQGLR